MDVLPFGAKSESNTVVGVAATNDGVIKTVKNWRNDSVNLFSRQATLNTGTSNIIMTDYCGSADGGVGVDVSDSAAVSLYIYNQLDLNFRLYAYAPTVGSNYRLYNAAQEWIYYDVSGGVGKRILITPDDFPTLQWLPILKFGLRLMDGSETVVNSGNNDALTISVIKKR